MKLCVALDMSSKQECLQLAERLADFSDKIWLKVGLRAYLRDGAGFIEELKKLGNFKIFLDLKLYDIPNTMADAAEEIAKLGVDMINIHASSGKRAMATVMERLDKLGLLGVREPPNQGRHKRKFYHALPGRKAIWRERGRSKASSGSGRLARGGS